MGNMTSVSCPVCGRREREGKWTCPGCTVEVNIHKELLRNLRHWRALYETGEVDDILTAGDGREYSLWDVDRFASARHLQVVSGAGKPPRRALAIRQAEAIEHFLLDNLTERESAIRMGISGNSPVAIYVTVGVSRLLGMAYRGEIPGYRLVMEEAS